MNVLQGGPPRGMRDWGPTESRLRMQLIQKISESYQLYGFSPIDTPAMETLDVLMGKNKGGDENEKLMFKILKRGQALKTSLHDEATQEPEVTSESDLGLRYDLTVPLARFISTHFSELQGHVFRCYHIGPVWRADRPQRGRFREFYQCDIDVIWAHHDWMYEVELFLATSRVLKALQLNDFYIRLSDKRILSLLFTGMGILPQDVSKVSIVIDKIRKKKFDEIIREIESIGLHQELNQKIIDFLKKNSSYMDPSMKYFMTPSDFLKFNQDYLTQAARQSLEPILHAMQSILENAKSLDPSLPIFFDPILVRGLDYYTGPIFEIGLKDSGYSFSIGGGGRYDSLIQTLGGPADTAAVGLSLGFERLLMILLERNKDFLSAQGPQVGILLSPKLTEGMGIPLAEQIRNQDIPVSIYASKKDFGKTMKMLEAASMQWIVMEQHEAPRSYTIRNLFERQNYQWSFDELIQHLKMNP